jgi:hypothetical protein
MMQSNDPDPVGTESPPAPARFGPIEVAFIRRYTHLLERVAKEASTEVLQDALAAPDDVGGLASILDQVGATLPPPVPDPLRRARMRGVRIKRELLERAGGTLSTGEAAGFLGVTPQAIHGRRTRRTLLGVRAANGDYVYPAFQFGSHGVLPGLADVLAAFQVDEPWTQLSVLLSPAGRLGGQTPLQALCDGRVTDAIEAVASYGEHVGT